MGLIDSAMHTTALRPTSSSAAWHWLWNTARANSSRSVRSCDDISAQLLQAERRLEAGVAPVTTSLLQLGMEGVVAVRLVDVAVIGLLDLVVIRSLDLVAIRSLDLVVIRSLDLVVIRLLVLRVQ